MKQLKHNSTHVYELSLQYRPDFEQHSYFFPFYSHFIFPSSRQLPDVCEQPEDQATSLLKRIRSQAQLMADANSDESLRVQAILILLVAGGSLVWPPLATAGTKPSILQHGQLWLPHLHPLFCVQSSDVSLSGAHLRLLLLSATTSARVRAISSVQNDREGYRQPDCKGHARCRYAMASDL